MFYIIFSHCIVYLNNILIYNNIKEKHMLHISKILKKLKQINLYLNINKCDFHIIKIKYLKLIIITKEVKMNLKKIKIIF